MRLGLIGLILPGLTAAGLALAEAPTTSPIPKPRPEAAEATTQAEAPRLRPRPRPANLTPPTLTPPGAQAQPAPSAQPSKVSAKGSVCGNPQIKGAALQAIKSRIKGCNVSAPVSVTSVNGVKLVPAATLNCTAAEALSTWVVQGLQPQFDNQVARLIIADSYSCRPRNNVPGAKVSEHGSGNAIDIEGLVLSSGKVLTVARNFRGDLRAAYKAACGTFHTTLGPGSDGYHENHLHLDTARTRGSPYCR